MKTADQIYEEINQITDTIYEGYEMGRLISAEFTPGPDYATAIHEYLDDNNISLDWLLSELPAEDSYYLHMMSQ